MEVTGSASSTLKEPPTVLQLSERIGRERLFSKGGAHAHSDEENLLWAQRRLNGRLSE
jgi:hypothetical protein